MLTPCFNDPTVALISVYDSGSNPRPGEISLAHRGVLFLDELPEFDRKVLEALREPLETGRVTISRAARQAEFPARFQLLAAMNPSPQGVEIHSAAAQRYRAKLSGPLLDRIDIHLEVPRVPSVALSEGGGEEEDSATVRQRVTAARSVMLARQGVANAVLTPAAVREFAPLTPSDRDLLDRALEKLRLSGRARDRIIKLARTIADLDGKGHIDTRCLTEAIGYRNLDRLFANG